MSSIAFCHLAEYLIQGREIEFAFNGRYYSITNHSGYWYLCNDTDHILLDALCRFDEKETLVSKIAVTLIDDLVIREIFDRRLYDTDSLCVL